MYIIFCVGVDISNFILILPILRDYSRELLKGTMHVELSEYIRYALTPSVFFLLFFYLHSMKSCKQNSNKSSLILQGIITHK